MVIVEGQRGSFGGEFEASHCNQWDGDVRFPNYFGDDLLSLSTYIKASGELRSSKCICLRWYGGKIVAHT